MPARRLVAVLCYLVTLLGFVVALSAPASAAPPLQWGKRHTIDPLRGGLVSVSCTSAQFCLAGGGNGDVMRWDGRSWRRQAVLDQHNAGIGDITCVSSSFCAAAVDSREGAYRPATFDGTRWTIAPDSVEGVGRRGNLLPVCDHVHARRQFRPLPAVERQALDARAQAGCTRSGRCKGGVHVGSVVRSGRFRRTGVPLRRIVLALDRQRTARPAVGPAVPDPALVSRHRLRRPVDALPQRHMDQARGDRQGRDRVVLHVDRVLPEH